MKFVKIAAVAIGLAAALPVATPVAAQEAAAETPAAEQLELRRGMWLISADGRRVGRIDTVVGEENAPVAVTVIKGMDIVSIPAETLSPGEDKGKVATSLNYRDIR